MSTELGKIGDLQVTSFYGGQERGPCIQLTSHGTVRYGELTGYSQLTRQQVLQLTHVLDKWLFNPALGKEEK